MKIKFNWGTGLFITIILFISFFVSFIIFSFSKERNLVTKDYFPDEIAYDLKLEKIKNTNALEQKINTNLTGKNLEIVFPDYFKKSEKINGTITLYYIKSYKQDKKYKINTDKSNKQFINCEKMPAGRYKINIDWEYDGKKYYQQNEIELK